MSTGGGGDPEECETARDLLFYPPAPENPLYMKSNLHRLIFLLTIGAPGTLVLTGAEVNIAVEWSGGRPQGSISVRDGTIANMRIAGGKGTVEAKKRFAAAQEGPLRLEVQVNGSDVQYGPGGTIVTIVTDHNPFSFFLRDVHSGYPILIQEYGVAVTDASDSRSYHQIAEAVQKRGLQSKLEQIEREPEESFATAAESTRKMNGQTWLGLSRDLRIFALGDRLDWILPRFGGNEVALPETGERPSQYNFLMGRGWGATDRITRRLEDGVLPIVHGALVDDDITYSVVAFVGLESLPLTAQNLRGTHFLVADGHGSGHMLTKEQKAEFDRLLPQEINRPEETVMHVRVTALNTAAVPRYAFFKSPHPGRQSPHPGTRASYEFDHANGLGVYKTGRVFVAARLNGRPLSQEEIAISIAPGEAVQFEFFLPHRPIPKDRALKLLDINFDERHESCRAFWQEKLAKGAQVQLPERRISEMMKAGLLHLDLITYGLEPDKTITPTIGRYSAIGSESSPIIQYFDSMGWHDVARRALMYFFDKQHSDGFMQNFGGYMLETGAVLWSAGEHYRYTRDDQWVHQIKPQLIKSCEFLQRWRERNLSEPLRGKGFGLLEGKSADPEDPFRSFMLNGYAYLGLSRVSEMLKETDPVQSERWGQVALALKNDIRTALFEAMGQSPVIPLRNGTWVPTVPPWVGYRGPVSLYADGGKWFSHGSMVLRDSLLGPLYLVFQEVVDSQESVVDFLLNFHSDLMTTRNVAFSQPYYSRHPITHLRRGEVKPFLKSYYNNVASLADRETYSFWEHYYQASPHKTHEEAWFLMDTRWMLYMERGDTLDLLPGIPRQYLESGKQIDLQRVATYFGPVSLKVKSMLEQGRVEATVECRTDRKPKAIELRLPHPQGRRATAVKGGRYDPQTERVRIEPFDGAAQVTVLYGPEK